MNYNRIPVYNTNHMCIKKCDDFFRLFKNKSKKKCIAIYKKTNIKVKNIQIFDYIRSETKTHCNGSTLLNFDS